jgi:lantibiotic leader peptide-processing serine protease
MHLRLKVLLLAAATALLVAGVAGAATYGASGSTSNYIVLYKQQAVPADAAATIQKAGGTVVQAWPQIGVVVASSDSASFRADLLKDARIENASATERFGIRIDQTETQAEGPPEGGLPNAPVTDSAEPLFPLQWDMRQISTPTAHAITGGSPAVVAADLDTGLDFTHPDIAPNYDPAHSADCEGGTPAPLAVGNDQNGHGTHTAGTIAAAANGIGIVGVAPRVKIAGIKTSNDDGYFFPEMVVCAFMFAGNTGVDVTNNSYFADPYLFNCHNDPTQRAIWLAESRAIRYAQTRGVTVVAAAGNFSDDLAHPTMDITSPDFPPGSEQERTVHNSCVVIPVEVPGVVGVSATGVFGRKSYYSNYGSGVIDVAAPGGDRFQVDVAAGAVNGRVLSTWPNYLPCSRQVTDQGAKYCYLQGTSMASPHITGLAALVISRFGRANGAGVEAIMQSTATPTACPTDLTPYEPFPSFSNGVPQTCTGGPGSNSWYGAGIVNAYNAITHATG